jgi:hypothetical protein
VKIINNKITKRIIPKINLKYKALNSWAFVSNCAVPIASNCSGATKPEREEANF